MEPKGPAYRIHTPRLVLRCWSPADAALLKEAIDASLDHLRPWMPWAMAEPSPLEAKIDLLRRWRGRFDLDKDFVYGILDLDEKKVLGGSGLHTRVGERALEIGYWIRAGYEKQGLATEATAALTRVAFEVNEVQRVEIHCDPRNAASAAVARKVGMVHEATLRERTLDSEGLRHDAMIWTLLASEYPSSPAKAIAVEAFDATGRQIL